MSKGFVVIAQNSQDDYVLQACLLAMSIKATQKEVQEYIDDLQMEDSF